MHPNSGDLIYIKHPDHVLSEFSWLRKIFYEKSGFAFVLNVDVRPEIAGIWLKLFWPDTCKITCKWYPFHPDMAAFTLISQGKTRNV